MREEQAGSRQERSCTDQIATLRIIEQSTEFQSSLYLDFVDFEKAFESVDHQVLGSTRQPSTHPEVFDGHSRKG